jgi:hypothetical protein
VDLRSKVKRLKLSKQSKFPVYGHISKLITKFSVLISADIHIRFHAQSLGDQHNANNLSSGLMTFFCCPPSVFVISGWPGGGETFLRAQIKTTHLVVSLHELKGVPLVLI